MPLPSHDLLAKAQTHVGPSLHGLGPALAKFRESYSPADSAALPLDTRLKLFELDAVDFCRQVVLTEDAPEDACHQAWLVLQDAAVPQRLNDPKELQPTNCGVQLGLLELAVRESAFKPWRARGKCMECAMAWPQNAASAEQHADRLLSSKTADMCLNLMRQGASSLIAAGAAVAGEHPRVFESALATVAFTARFRAAALLEMGVMDVTHPLLGLLGSEEHRMAGFFAALIVIRCVGKSESWDTIKQHPMVIDTLLFYLNGGLQAGPQAGFLFAGTNWQIAYLLDDLRTISISDRNKPLLLCAVAPIASALKLLCHTDKAVAANGLDTLLQLSFEPSCRPEIARLRSTIEPAAKFVTAKHGFDREAGQTAVNFLEAMGWARAPKAAAGGSRAAAGGSRAAAGGSRAATRESREAIALADSRAADKPRSGGGFLHRVAAGVLGGGASSAKSKPSAARPPPAGSARPPAAPAPSRRMSAQSRSSPARAQEGVEDSVSPVAPSYSSAAPEMEADEDEKAQDDDDDAAEQEEVGQPPAAGEQWVMLSYNQKSAQPQALAMHQGLAERGMPVWIDVFDMKSNLSDAMAEAVEGARAVVVFVTSAYKESANCRLECEYAFEQKKPVVWVMCEPDYKPNGWLGLKMGAALWFNGVTVPALHGEMPRLLKEVAGGDVPAKASASTEPAGDGEESASLAGGGRSHGGTAAGSLGALTSELGGIKADMATRTEMAELRRQVAELKTQLDQVLAILCSNGSRE